MPGSRRLGWTRLSALSVVAVLVSACQADIQTPPPLPTSLQFQPTATSTLPAVDTPAPQDIPIIPVEQAESAAPQPQVTLPPALVLPDASGATIACPANTGRWPLVSSLSFGDAFGAVSRMEVVQDWIYLLIDGGLYRVDHRDVDAAPVDLASLALEPVLMPGEAVDGLPVQELSDLSVGGDGVTLHLLDKAGHVFSLEGVTLDGRIAYRALPSFSANDVFDPQMMALTIDPLGRVLLLDSARALLWTPQPPDEDDGRVSISLEQIGGSQALLDGVDLTAIGGTVYTLQQNGSIRTVINTVGSSPWRAANDLELGLSLRTSTHLGPEMLVLVDGLRREVLTIVPAADSPNAGQVITRHRFAFADLGLLRDAVFAHGRLYAVADTDLLIFPGPAESQGDSCQAAQAAGFAPPELYGRDILTLTENWVFPISDASLPEWPRLYPGARRLYRSGVHRGLDIYRVNAPVGFSIGYPIAALAPGEVTSSTLLYNPMTEDEWDERTENAELAGQTSAESYQRFSGRRVVINHGAG
ncbi:MAG: hypothetical protein GYB68_01675, partial [Chloroflexi bacterium]|nr:hypothetical protein [Chloroflexota bacterium]